jgi:hypothetical protein
MDNTNKIRTVIIDAGHSSIKYALHAGSAAPRISVMPSLVARLAKNHDEPKNAISANGIQYATGKDALPYLDNTSGCPTDDSWVGSENFFFLLQGVFKDLRINGSVDVFLSMPDGMLREKRGPVTKHLTLSPDFNSSTGAKVQQVDIIGQRMATTLAPGLKLHAGNTVCIDVGHKTILLTVREGVRYMADRSRTIEFGGAELLRQIAANYTTSQSEQTRIAVQLLRSKLQRATVMHQDQLIVVDPITVEKTHWPGDAVTRITDAIKTFSDIQNVVLSGGCGTYLRKEIQNKGKHLKIFEPEKPQLAVIQGMLRFLEKRRPR